MGLWITILSSLLLALGLWLVAAWGKYQITPPPGKLAPSMAGRRGQIKEALRRYFWWVNLVCFATLVSAVLTGWAGNRLIMRILAVTSPDAALQSTELGNLVDVPTVTGTLALLIFTGPAAGLVASFIFVLIHRWLPPGRLAGPTLGALLLLAFGVTLEPLRPNNPDFDIVGPGWLSVLMFTVLAIFHGALVAAVSGWFSQRLPLFSRRLHWRIYLPLLVILVFPPVLFGSILVMPLAGAIYVVRALRRIPQRQRQLSSKSIWIGRAVLGVVAAATLPLFIMGVSTIVSST